MRRIHFFGFIIIAVFVVILFSSCSAGPENAEVKLTVLNSMERIGQDQALFGANQASISAAKNETESFQVVVGAIQKNIRVVGVEMTDLSGSAGTIGKENISLFREEYARVRRSSPRAQLPPGLYADPLVPFINPLTGKPIEPFHQYRIKWGTPFISSGYEMYALPFDVWKGQNQPIWVDVYIPASASPGEYKGTFTVTLDDMPELFGPVADSVQIKSISVPVTLTVWDFTLPEGPTHRNHFGSVSRAITPLFDAEANSDRAREIEMRYCQMMADHRINPPIPESLMPEVNPDGSLKIIPERHEALKKYLQDLHVTDFEIHRAPFKDMTTTNRSKALRYYSAIHKYVKENGWDKRAYVYMLDEPNLKENYEEVLALGALVHEAAPELRCLVVEQTYKQDPAWPDMDPAIDIWCPLFAFIDRETVNEKIGNGDEVWSYTALSQRAPEYHPKYNEYKDYDSPYWHLDALPTSYRTPTWLNRQYNINGLLYWSIVTISRTATGVMDPWLLPAFSESESQFNAGGYLIYPGVPCGMDGPVGCIRLKILRDGMEDYEYFTLLEERGGKDAAMKFVSAVAPDWWATSEDPQLILDTREAMAAEIVRLKK